MNELKPISSTSPRPQVLSNEVTTSTSVSLTQIQSTSRRTDSAQTQNSTTNTFPSLVENCTDALPIIARFLSLKSLLNLRVSSSFFRTCATKLLATFKISIAITLDEFKNASKETKFLFATSNNLGLTLKLKNPTELTQLLEILKTQNRSDNQKSIFPHIQGLDFSSIDVDSKTQNEMNALLECISQTPSLFPNLTSLSFGNIWSNVQLTLNQLNNLKELFLSRKDDIKRILTTTNLSVNEPIKSEKGYYKFTVKCS